MGEKEINDLRSDIKLLKKQTDINKSALDMKKSELIAAVLKYTETTGKAYSPSLNQQGKEFCDDYYYEVDNNSLTNNYSSMFKFYDTNASVNIIGWGTLDGRNAIIDGLTVC
jgi:hypothetical protein